MRKKAGFGREFRRLHAKFIHRNKKSTSYSAYLKYSNRKSRLSKQNGRLDGRNGDVVAQNGPLASRYPGARLPKLGNQV